MPRSTGEDKIWFLTEKSRSCSLYGWLGVILEVKVSWQYIQYIQWIPLWSPVVYSAGEMWLFLHKLLRSVVVCCLLQTPGAIGDAAGHPNKCPWALLSSDPVAEQPAQQSHWESPVAPKEQPLLHTSCVSHCQGLASSVQALPQPPHFVFKVWDFLSISHYILYYIKLLPRDCRLTSKQYSCVGMLTATGEKILMKEPFLADGFLIQKSAL